MAKAHGIAALDQLGSAVLVGRYTAQHPVLEQLNQKLEARSAALPRMWKSASSVPTRRPPGGSPRQCRRGKPTSSARQTCCGCLSSGRFSVVWGLALAMATVLLRQNQDKSDRYLFAFGTVLGGVYEYVCSAVTELLFGTVFWDYSKFNLGGRINLLYCFFWGIAAAMWMRYGYPLVLKLMKKVRSHIRPWVTAALAVFMAVNMLTSALALARYDARTSGDAPNGQLEVFLDEHFDNARMEHIYPNAKKVTKAE